MCPLSKASFLRFPLRSVVSCQVPVYNTKGNERVREKDIKIKDDRPSKKTRKLTSFPPPFFQDEWV